MATWLIIGDSSFTGTALAKSLIDTGHDVTGVSLRTSAALDAIDFGGWDYIVNCAALNVVAPSWDYPADYMTTNVVKQVPLFNAMVRLPPKRYIHVSTPEVYGSTRSMVRESAPFNPSTPYATSRAAAEMLLRNYVSHYQLPAIVTRAANVYGPKQQLYRIIPKLIHTIKSGNKFNLEGGGHSLRAFVHIKDVAQALEIIAYKGTVGSAYHISNAQHVWIKDLVAMVCARMGTTFRDVVTVTPDRPGKDEAYSLDASALYALGWQATISLDDGIEDVAKWMNRTWDTLKDEPTDYVFTP